MENRLLLSMVTGVIFTCLFSLIFILGPKNKTQRLVEGPKPAKKFDVQLTFEIDKDKNGQYPDTYRLAKELDELKKTANYFSEHNSLVSTNDHKIIVRLRSVIRNDSSLVVNLFDPKLSVGFYEIYAVNEMVPFIKALITEERKEVGKRNLVDRLIFFSEPSTEIAGSIFFPVEVGQARTKDSAIVEDLLTDDSIEALIPKDAVLMFGNTTSFSGYFSIYAIKTRPTLNEAILTGNDIEVAQQEYTHSGDVQIRIKFTRKGARKWEKITARNVGRSIAIVVNNFVISTPRVTAKIVEGDATVNGRFTVEEAQTIALELNSGRSTFPMTLLHKEFTGIGPSIFETYRNIIGIMLCFILFAIIAYFMLPIIIRSITEKS